MVTLVALPEKRSGLNTNRQAVRASAVESRVFDMYVLSHTIDGVLHASNCA